MLLSITESCHMGCSHCMDDAKPCDRHMSKETFKDAIEFFNKFGGMELIITGGEPTDHPDWLPFLYYALRNAKGSMYNNAHITLITNAMNIAGKRDIQTYLLSLMDMYRLEHGASKLSIQVTHVDKYYPQEVDLSEPFFNTTIICREIEAMYPMGRAKTNNLPWKSKCSKCFNIRSLAGSVRSLKEVTSIMALYGKFCTPQIDISGNIKLGESVLCPVATNIYKSDAEIMANIRAFTCGNCAEVNKNLTNEQLKAIGESR